MFLCQVQTSEQRWIESTSKNEDDRMVAMEIWDRWSERKDCVDQILQILMEYFHNLSR